MSLRRAGSETRPVARAPSQPPGTAPARLTREHRPFDFEPDQMAEKPRDAEEEPDDEVRPDGCVRRQLDTAHERREPKRSQDQPDGTSQEADRPARDHSREARPPQRRGGAQLEEEVEPVPRDNDGDEREQKVAGDEVAEQPAEERADDRGGRHPGDDAPADAPRAGMRDPAGERGGRAHCDVRAGGRGRASGGQQDGGKPEAPQDEPHHRAEEARDE